MTTRQFQGTSFSCFFNHDPTGDSGAGTNIEASLGSVLRLLLLRGFGHVEQLCQILPISFEIDNEATESTNLVRAVAKFPLI